MTLNAYPPDEDLEKHCLKKLEAASADVVEDEVQTPLLICLKDIVQLLENGDPAKCMFLGEVKTLGPHYKVNLTVDPVLLGAHERTTRLVLASPTSKLEAHDPLGPSTSEMSKSLSTRPPAVFYDHTRDKCQFSWYPRTKDGDQFALVRQAVLFVFAIPQSIC